MSSSGTEKAPKFQQYIRHAAGSRMNLKAPHDLSPRLIIIIIIIKAQQEQQRYLRRSRASAQGNRGPFAIPESKIEETHKVLFYDNGEKRLSVLRDSIYEVVRFGRLSTILDASFGSCPSVIVNS